MHSSCKTLALTLTGLCALGFAARPVSAQNLVYTLSDVTFNDGAVATGFFDFNPTTHTFGTYDITTTNGVSDALTGAVYTPASSTSPVFGTQSEVFIFATDSTIYNYLVLAATSSAASPGTYSLDPGTDLSLGGFSGSGELAPVNTVARGVTTGSLMVTPAAAVPEASTTVSFGLLLALGLGGGAIAARRKKATAA